MNTKRTVRFVCRGLVLAQNAHRELLSTADELLTRSALDQIRAGRRSPGSSARFGHRQSALSNPKLDVVTGVFPDRVGESPVVRLSPVCGAAHGLGNRRGDLC